MEEIKPPEDINFTTALRKVEYYEVQDKMFGLIVDKKKVHEESFEKSLFIESDWIKENDRIYINGVEYTKREYD